MCERAEYLRATWQTARRPETVNFDTGTGWLGLEVRAERRLDDAHAEVEFVARSRLHGRATRLHEQSCFVRENGANGVARWFYVDGTLL